MEAQPMYDTLVEEQGFNPQDVLPFSVREDRKMEHDKWYHETLVKVRNDFEREQDPKFKNVVEDLFDPVITEDMIRNATIEED